MKELCIKCGKQPRYVRPYDGKELEMCFECAKKWSKAFERALLNPQFVKGLSSNL